MVSDADMFLLHKRLLAALAAHEGSAWKEVRAELHFHYNELPVWVLLYEDSDIDASHSVFKRAVVPFIEALGEIQLTLNYFIIKGGERYHRDMLTTTSDILSASGEALGEWHKQSNRHVWMFNANSSAHDKA